MQCILEYIAIALMVLNIVGYAVNKSISCIALFGVGAYIARCFSKNLTINIFAGLLVSNVFFGCSSLREGFSWWTPVADAKKKLKQTQKEMTANIVKGVADAQQKIKDEAAAAQQKIKDKAAAAQSGVTSKMNEAKQGVLGAGGGEEKKTGCVVNDEGNKWIGKRVGGNSIKHWKKQLPIQCFENKNKADCNAGKSVGTNNWCEWK